MKTLPVYANVDRPLQHSLFGVLFKSFGVANFMPNGNLSRESHAELLWVFYLYVEK